MNQRIAEATGRPVDALTTDLLSEAIDRNFFTRISEIDSDRDAIRLAESTISGQQRNAADGTPIYQGTPNGSSIFALFAFDTGVIFTLHTLDDWKALADSTIPKDYRTCDAQSDRDCQSGSATETLAIKRWDRVCIYRCCSPCRAFFDLDPSERDSRRHLNFDDDSLADPFPDRERIWLKPENDDPWS
jgi:hypothetical protein